MLTIGYDVRYRDRFFFDKSYDGLGRDYNYYAPALSLSKESTKRGRRVPQPPPQPHPQLCAAFVFGGILHGPFGNSAIVNPHSAKCTALGRPNRRHASQPLGLELEGHGDLNALLCAISPRSP